VAGSEESVLFKVGACEGKSGGHYGCLVRVNTTFWTPCEGLTIVIVFLVDYSVPVSKLPDLIYETKKDLEEVGLVSTVIGHVGDGNFHAMMLVTTDEELEIAQKAAHRMVHRAIAMDGTCS
jgi:FAD/FMN-containing dehydrogenase